MFVRSYRLLMVVFITVELQITQQEITVEIQTNHYNNFISEVIIQKLLLFYFSLKLLIKPDLDE